MRQISVDVDVDVDVNGPSRPPLGGGGVSQVVFAELFRPTLLQPRPTRSEREGVQAVGRRPSEPVAWCARTRSSPRPCLTPHDRRPPVRPARYRFFAFHRQAVQSAS
jgi:hypothetical protein